MGYSSTNNFTLFFCIEKITFGLLNNNDPNNDNYKRAVSSTHLYKFLKNFHWIERNKHVSGDFRSSKFQIGCSLSLLIAQASPTNVKYVLQSLKVQFNCLISVWKRGTGQNVCNKNGKYYSQVN